MAKILIASLSDFPLARFLGDSFVKQNEVILSTSASRAKRLIIDDPFSLIIINTPLEDEIGTDFAIIAAEKTSAGVMTIVKANVFDIISTKLEPYGVLVMGNPCQAEYARQSARLLIATSRRMQSMKKSNTQLRSQISEIKTIDRSKLVLMQYLGLSETEAHKFIERRAMDSRKSRYEIALDIIKTYES